MVKKLLLFCVVVLLSSCTYNQQIKNINEKLGKIQNSTEHNTIDLNTIKPKISLIEEKLNMLSKKIDILENATNSTKLPTKKTIVEAQIDNNTNIGNNTSNVLNKIPPASLVFSNKTQNIQKKLNNEQNKSSQKISNENPKPTFEKNLTTPTAQALNTYQDALSTYMKRDFNSALYKFLQFLKDYPQTNLEQNAYFWVGNSYYNLNNYDKALNYFFVCLNNFPKKSTSEGGKTDACLFMLYKTYKAMGNVKKSYDYLMQLKKDYPINPYFEFRGVKN